MASAAILAAVVGCGGKVASGDDQAEAMHDATGVTSTPDWVHDRTAELRLLGVDSASYARAALYLAEVEVKASGKVLETKNSQAFVDLATASQAWLLGRVQVPDGEKELELRVRFKAQGGDFLRGTQHGAIDGGCAEIRIVVPVKGLEARGHAVLHVDVEESLRRNGEMRVFLPQLKLVF